MKWRLMLPLLVCLGLALFAEEAVGIVGLGVSHYDPHSSVKLGTTETVLVAQVNAVGDEPLMVVASWKQTSGNLTLPVHVNISDFQLEPNTAKEIFIIVDVPSNESFLGNYTGEVELNCQYVKQVKGNPTVPGGTAKAWIMVTPKEIVVPSPESSSLIPFWVLGTLVVTLFYSLIVGSVYIVYRRRKNG